MRQLFLLLGDRLGKHVGLDLRRYGVGRAERLRRSTDPLAAAIEEIVAGLGVADVEIYVTTRQPTIVVAEPTAPLSLVVGSELAVVARPGELRFVVGRAVKLALAALAVPARMTADELGVLLVGLLRLFAPDTEATGLDEATVATEQQRLRRLIPSSLLAELAPFAHELLGKPIDHRRVWQAIVDGGNRAGLLTAGSAPAALAALARMGGYPSFHQATHDASVASLLRFAVSEDHVALRAMLEH